MNCKSCSWQLAVLGYLLIGEKAKMIIELGYKLQDVVAGCSLRD